MTLVRKGGVDSLIRRPDARLRSAVVHGPDRAAVGELARALLARLTPDIDDPFTVALLGDGDLDPGRLASELAAGSLSGRRRIVRLRLVGDVGAKDKFLQEVLQDHLDDAYVSDAFFLVECPALDKRSGLRKLAEASDRTAAVALYEEETADTGRMAREMLQEAGIRPRPQTLAAIVQRLPRDRGSARRAIESLILYAGAEVDALDLHDVEAVLAPDLGAITSDVALSAFSGRIDRTVASLNRARFTGESGPALLRSLALHRSRLARAKAAVEGGASPQSALRSVGVFWKEEQEVAEQLDAWRARDLDDLQATLTIADVACKTAGAPDEVIAHHCALGVALHAARRAGRSSVR